jgi:ADP-heptose:LPS heptosyltransferase
MPRTATAARALWLHPGSGSPAKSIPPAELAEFALQERHSPGMPLIVSFGEADTGLRTPVRKAFAQKGLSFEEVVCPSLRELRRRLEQDAGAFVGPDTGVTHLAAALGIPVTAVFRVTDPAIWRPVGRVRVVRND